MAPRYTTTMLKNLRDVMKNTKYVSDSLHAYIIPSIDAHQSEYIASCDKRRDFISGFTGSAGTAVVTEKHAALWTDGRYFLQAKSEMDENWILMKDRLEGTPSIGDWLNKILPGESLVGFDPLLLNYATWKDIDKELQSTNNKLVPVERNLIDLIWDNKPSRPSNAIDYLPDQYTGCLFSTKVSLVRQNMMKENVDTLIISALDEVAWLFNLRGSDIDYNPVFFAYSIVTMDKVFLCLEQEKLTLAAQNSLKESSVDVIILPYDSILTTLQKVLDKSEGKVWLNRKSSYAIVSTIPAKRRLLKTTPVETLKSIKNETEIQGAKIAHIKDAASLCEFFYWLSHEISRGNVTETSAADKLESFRKGQKDFVSLSFPTITSSGPNAAIIHYHVTEETNRKLDLSEIYLVDSGAQYKNGTTDVTRTWHFGEPTSFEKKCYTLVLKGHIALSSAVFPKNCTGHRIDSLARKFLWEAGLDYLHGTGHGVGSYLNVHEGPSGISWLYNSDDPGIEAGMILSIEPGYYEDGKFGIRLENLAVVKEIQTPHHFQGKQFLTFEPLTLVPFQTKLIEPSLLTTEEITWLNNYHTVCQLKVGKLLREQGKKEVLQWLMEATLPLS